MGHKAVKTTHNINNAFSIGNANTHTVQWWFKKFYKRDESLEMRSMVVGHRKLITTNQLWWSSYNYMRSCQRTQHLPFHSHLASEQTGKVKNLDKWVPHELTKKKSLVWSVVLLLFYMTASTHLLIRLWCMMKSGFPKTAGDDQLSGWTEKELQSTSQSQTCSKKSHGHCLVICCLSDH